MFWKKTGSIAASLRTRIERAPNAAAHLTWTSTDARALGFTPISLHKKTLSLPCCFPGIYRKADLLIRLHRCVGYPSARMAGWLYHFRNEKSSGPRAHPGRGQGSVVWRHLRCDWPLSLPSAGSRDESSAINSQGIFAPVLRPQLLTSRARLNRMRPPTVLPLLQALNNSDK